MTNGNSIQGTYMPTVPDWVIRDIKDLKEHKADKDVVDMIEEKAEEAKRLALSARKHECAKEEDLKNLKIAVEGWSLWFRRIVIGVFGSILTSLVIAVSQYFMLRTTVYNTQSEVMRVQSDLKTALETQVSFRRELDTKLAQEQAKEDEKISEIKKAVKAALIEVSEENQKK